MPAAVRMAIFYVAFFLGWGCVLPYWPVWYAGRGLSPEMIGIAGGAGLMARMLVSPVAAFWSDGVRRAKDPLIALSALTVLFWLAHIPVREPWMLVVLAFVTGSALYPVIPLMDSLTMREARLDGFAFGPVRAVGSAAFIVANLAAGALIGELGGEAMLGWMIGAAMLMAAVSLLLPGRERSAPAEPVAVRLRGMRALLANRGFMLALLSSSAVTSSHAFYYGFSALAWGQEGMAPVLVGALWGFAVAAEVVFLAVSAKFASRVDPAALILLGAAAACVRWVLLAFSPPLAVVLVLQSLHAVSFGATYLGFLHYAEREAGEHRAAGAFALNSALSGGALSALMTALSGWLFAYFGSAGFAAMAIPALLGGAGALWLLLAGRQPQSAKSSISP